MRWFKSILVTVGTMILGMFGGQKNKGARRFGIFGLSLTMDGFTKRSWPLILIVPTLVMGYGENSWLYAKFGNDNLVRFIYAICLSFPFMFYGFIRWGFACALLVGAFQIHASSLGYISWFGDILIEDIIRYGILGGLISFNLFLSR